MKKLNFMLPMMILIVVILGCGGESKTEEERSGRLKFVKKLRYGSVGTHGSQGWYVNDRYFKVNDQSWSPAGIEVKDISGCYASPNEAVEALNCHSFKGGKERAYVLRIKTDKPEWVTASDDIYSSGNNLGEWIGDGRWLLFTNYYFNVETSEKIEIKGLPDDPESHLRAVSPDLKTIIYEETGFTTRLDLPPNESHEEEIKKQYKLFYEHREKGIVAFWLIDTASGKMKLLELKKEKYPILSRTGTHSHIDWLRDFQKMLVWEKDKEGKYQLIFPN